MKTEKEKMLNGDYYNASDPVLVSDRENARRLTVNTFWFLRMFGERICTSF